MKPPVRVTVTGAAGNIGYALVFRIAAGDMFGEDQPVILQLLEVPPALGALTGIGMELEDCAFPLLHDVILTDDPAIGFHDTDYALLIGARPRGPGMERKDLLTANAKIFAAQGRHINEYASRDIRVLVVGNPANTNCLIAATNAPDIDPRHFTAMMRLDHNRAIAQLANKTGTLATFIHKVTVWGNHSATQYPDIHHCLVDGTPAVELVDPAWMQDTLIPTVQQRGSEVIKARGTSSAGSAADAIVDHMHSWVLGTRDDDWVSMAVPSDGSYGIGEGVIYSFPVTCRNGDYEIVQGLEINDFSRGNMDASAAELHEERTAVADLL